MAETVQQIRRRAKARQLKFRKYKKYVETWFKIRDIPLQSDIWIYPDYPFAMEAVVCAFDRVWIMRSYYPHRTHDLFVKDVQHVKGFRLNGTIIFS